MERNRIDLWLKMVCLFKHRSEATEACRGGLVKLNGERVKPAAPVKPGDAIEFTQGERLRRVEVRLVPNAQASKEAAREMYVDHSPPPPPRELIAAPVRDRGMGRPTKRDRREMERLRKR